MSEIKIDDGESRTRRQITLSLRKRQVLRRLCRFDGDKQIAAALGISPRTVAQYMRQMLQDAHVRSRCELSGWAFLNPQVLEGGAAWPGLHRDDCECDNPVCRVIRYRDAA